MDENMEQVIRASASQIEDKVTVERIIDPKTNKEKKLIEVRRRCGLEDGKLKEETGFNLSTYDCGCASHGRKNLGGIDYKGNVVCVKHFYRCPRCHRPVSVLTIWPKNGKPYCRRCGLIRRILPIREG